MGLLLIAAFVSPSTKLPSDADGRAKHHEKQCSGWHLPKVASSATMFRQYFSACTCEKHCADQ